MTVILMEEKMANTVQLVNRWSHKAHANIHELQAVLGKLFYIAQCYPQARLTVNQVTRSLPTHWLSAAPVTRFSKGCCLVV